MYHLHLIYIPVWLTYCCILGEEENNSNSFFEGIYFCMSLLSVIIDNHVDTSVGWLHMYKAMTCFKVYVVMLMACCITGLGVGIAVGIVTSSLVFGIAIITVRIIAKYRVKGNCKCTHPSY